MTCDILVLKWHHKITISYEERATTSIRSVQHGLAGSIVKGHINMQDSYHDIVY